MDLTQLWKTKVSWRRQQALLDARVRLRGIADPKRPVPELVVIGAQRCGTSSLYKWLEQHPDVAPSVRKETEYLSYRHPRGEAWYRGHFPSRLRRAAHGLRGRPLLTFEASPYYLFHPLAAARAAALVPDVRLVVLLRDPTERAWSHYQHQRRLRQEDLGFAAALDQEEERLAGEEERLAAEPGYDSVAHRRYGYVARGRYAGQLARWLVHYPRERLLVLRSEDLYGDSAGTYARVLVHAGLAPFDATFHNASRAVGDHAEPMARELRTRLDAALAPEVAALEALLGTSMGWTGPQAP